MKAERSVIQNEIYATEESCTVPSQGDTLLGRKIDERSNCCSNLARLTKRVNQECACLEQGVLPVALCERSQQRVVLQRWLFSTAMHVAYRSPSTPDNDYHKKSMLPPIGLGQSGQFTKSCPFLPCEGQVHLSPQHPHRDCRHDHHRKTDPRVILRDVSRELFNRAGENTNKSEERCFGGKN